MNYLTIRQRMHGPFLSTEILFIVSCHMDRKLAELGIETEDSDDMRWVEANICLSDIAAWIEAETEDQGDPAYGKTEVFIRGVGQQVINENYQKFTEFMHSSFKAL